MNTVALTHAGRARLRHFVVYTLAAWSLTGCFPTMDPEELVSSLMRIEEKATPQVGETTREQVLSALGEPFARLENDRILVYSLASLEWEDGPELGQDCQALLRLLEQLESDGIPAYSSAPEDGPELRQDCQALLPLLDHYALLFDAAGVLQASQLEVRPIFEHGFAVFLKPDLEGRLSRLKVGETKREVIPSLLGSPVRQLDEGRTLMYRVAVGKTGTRQALLESLSSRSGKPVELVVVLDAAGVFQGYQLGPVGPIPRSRPEWTSFLKRGQTTKAELLATLGLPVAQFERGRILTYRLGKKYRVVSGTGAGQPATGNGRALLETRGEDWLRARYSLVLVLDGRRILTDYSFVEVRASRQR